jgi:hypothetical protein
MMRRPVSLRHIRLAIPLGERIEQAAEANRRSVNAEIESRLMLSFEYEAKHAELQNRLDAVKAKAVAAKARQEIITAAMKKMMARMTSEQTVDLLGTFLNDVGEDI